MTNPYLLIKNLKVNSINYEGKRNIINIDEISINKGDSYGIIGESGTGKTVLALTILKLLEMPPGEIESGSIIFDGYSVLEMSQREMERKIRGKKIAMIFQDPMSTLNPVFTIGYQMLSVIMRNQHLKKKSAYEKALEMISTVKLPDAERIMKKFPHELSGGQRQRIIIALALSCGAELIIADEPTRNLDVTIQAGILKLLKELQDKFKVTVLYIANNPGLISATCDKTAVLYRGEVVEKGLTRSVLRNPLHPYTQALLKTMPNHNAGETNLMQVEKSKNDIISGKSCIYYDKCPMKEDSCLNSQNFIKIDDMHYVKCHLVKRC
ncbi:MAG: ABC transporter ATP-binding protein [Tissierellales bacterium]|nr:ABC transporter ATP-binding protein [Tissierellales bacterium]MBN2827074.1 ABC transporter ATP-binding protein [Tissierellales bacterium]